MQSKYFSGGVLDACRLVDDQFRDRGYILTGEARVNFLSNMEIELQQFVGCVQDQRTMLSIITTVANRVSYFIDCGLAEPMQHTEVFID